MPEGDGNKKPANHCWLRVQLTSMDYYGFVTGAEGETRTRTTVGRYPLKIVKQHIYQIVAINSRIYSRSILMIFQTITGKC